MNCLLGNNSSKVTTRLCVEPLVAITIFTSEDCQMTELFSGVNKINCYPSVKNKWLQSYERG